ncbi:MAG: hypothetical protein H6718_19710 [Polyangiaceae bacterium]|nr:hypothetical protein [Myxococcales bacterium]MCB9587639.1 hypothetical protein [Polyangiaceae bacterium]MCB9605564.1 hypothetical protein [Polyangiaceae bacterium]
MKRRDFLGTIGAALSAPLAGCGPSTSRRVPAVSPPPQASRVDGSFAELLMTGSGDPSLRPKLLAHPALAAIVRHQKLSGNTGATPEAALEDVFKGLERHPPTRSVLDAWRGRDTELLAAANAAARYLPQGNVFSGEVYLVAGYDIGVAAPPDLILNVAHPHFVDDPRELGFYATHEAHHVGFLALRSAPALTDLNQAPKLRAVVTFMTQLEGMGVHAAYPARSEQHRLDGDDDYQVYADPAQAKAVTERYAELTTTLAQTDGSLEDELVGNVLNAMSSGQRVWYRFGALVCWHLEQHKGRQALIASIRKPELFEEAVRDLLSKA